MNVSKRLVYNLLWLKRERELTQEELDEFLGINPAGVALAPDGVERALLLPYTKILSAEDIVIGKPFHHFARFF